MRIIAEPEFKERIKRILASGFEKVGAVTGPGRSGAVAAVYASHIFAGSVHTVWLRPPFTSWQAFDYRHSQRKWEDVTKGA